MRALAVLFCLVAAAPAHADSVWCKTYDQDLWRQPYTKIPAPLDIKVAAVDDVDPCLATSIYEKVGLRDAAAVERKRCAVRSALAIRLATPDSPLLQPRP